MSASSDQTRRPTPGPHARFAVYAADLAPQAGSASQRSRRGSRKTIVATCCISALAATAWLNPEGLPSLARSAEGLLNSGADLVGSSIKCVGDSLLGLL